VVELSLNIYIFSWTSGPTTPIQASQHHPHWKHLKLSYQSCVSCNLYISKHWN